jgi:hypothetical protein
MNHLSYRPGFDPSPWELLGCLTSLGALIGYLIACRYRPELLLFLMPGIIVYKLWTDYRDRPQRHARPSFRVRPTEPKSHPLWDRELDD